MVTEVINAIRQNLLVCFPTETVYALSCKALDGEAIEKIYRIKKRSQHKPLSIFVNSIHTLMTIAHVKEKYINLINRLSPGPVTYVMPLNKERILPSKFFKESVGIRIPNHPIAISILDKLRTPIIATSINISGEKSVCKASDIPRAIAKHLAVIIKDDTLVSGIESMVIDLTTDKIKVLREGEGSDLIGKKQ